jgi:lipoprotein-releasing system ATP-binding protein
MADYDVAEGVAPDASGATPALFLSRVARSYRQGETTLDILRGADLALWPGETVALVAPSGTGKSTLLHVAGLLEKPDGGEVYVGGEPTSDMDDGGRTRLRREGIGFVYQFHHLLPEFSALENVAMPQLIRGLGKAEARRRGGELLDFLGLRDRHGHPPGRAVGGRAAAGRHRPRRRQRPAPAPGRRADRQPRPAHGGYVFSTLVSLVRASGLAALVATHNLDLAARMDRCVTLRDGLVVETG